jgi:HJR/Mrr/RecB family endonuclease
MAATHTPTRRTRKTATRRRAWRLPRLGGWWIAVILTVIAVARTWPLYTGAVTALIAIAAVIAVVRPRRLARPHGWATTLIHIINTHRTRMPAPGHRTLATFLAMNPTQFEHAITHLAQHTPGVHQATHSGRPADRGIDVHVTLHNGHRILIQCKHHTTGKNVGGDTIREIAGSVLAARCHSGVIVTTTGFTPEAHATNYDLAAHGHGLTLVDGHDLTTWANGGTPPWN